MSIQDFFSNGTCDLPGLANYLDGLAPATRISEATSVNGKQQLLLWEAAEGGTRLTLADFVPDDKAPLTEVIHWGKNSLPLFRTFQKRFCRPDTDAAATQRWGYNEQILRLFTGPGYFVARETRDGESDNHGVVIDYTLEPAGKVESWPTFIPNNKRLSRWIYNGTNDYMRKVSAHVTIGRAKKAAATEWMDNWFVLCREA